MNDLNNQQLILLCILVSFVASIATSISTVTLLEEAPPVITQTINRVVEKTVQTVVPDKTPSILTREVTVVVKEEDLVTAAVEKNLGKIVRIFEGSTSTFDGTKPHVAIGFIVSTDGFIILDGNSITNEKNYTAVTPSGNVFGTEIVKKENKTIAVLRLVPKDLGKKTEWDAVALLDSKEPKLGTTVLAIGGPGNAIYKGIISETKRAETPVEGEIPADSFVRILTNIPLEKKDTGGPLLNLDGNIIGINIVSGDSSFAVSSGDILDILSSKSGKSEPEPTGKVVDKTI